MAPTAAVDFGGRKATATCSGLVDGCTYIGSGIQSVCIGYLVPNQASDTSKLLGILPLNWHWWPVFLIPFGLLGLWVAIKIWNELPEATRKYIEREKKAKAAK